MHFCSGCEKQSPSFVSGPQTRIETGKAIIGEIVLQALKSYQHEGWIGLGDTYGPMHYPGMRSLWQSPANFHQHLAFPSPSLHQALLPGSLFSSYTSSSLSKPCMPVIFPGWQPFMERKQHLYSPAGMAEVDGVQSRCIVSHHDGTDC